MTNTVSSQRRERTFLGHPIQLATLFGVEMWERFSFYGMQGILLLYMYYEAVRGGLGIDEGVAAGIVGAYGGTVYLSTILAAWVADRLFGPERVLFGSAISVMAGHIALALIPGGVGLAIGLVLVAFGSGGVKANASTILATLYGEGDDRRDAGFSIFYLGVNIGALVGPLLTGLFQETWGFHAGFGEMPVTWTQSIEPVFVILLAGVFATVWTTMGPRQPSSPMKMAAGTVIVGIGFLLFVPLAGTGPNGSPLIALVGILLVFCVAELLTSPVGQSLATKLAPTAFRTQMVALFFLSVSMGTVLSGLLADYYSEDVEVAYFGITGAAAIVVGLVVVATVPKLTVLMEGMR